VQFSLSIITINYNNKVELEKTICSVVEQSFKNFEFIVIDGGSKDGSLDIIKKYESRINQYVSERDNGIYDAQNKGIKAANGKYLMFLNASDCFYSKDSLANLFTNDFEEDIVYCNYCVKGTNVSIKNPALLQFRHFWYRSTICHQTALISKHLFNRYGLYDTSLTIVADWEFFLKTIFLYGASYKYIDVDLVSVDVKGISSSKEGHDLAQKQRTLIQQKYFGGFVEDYKILNEYFNNPVYKIASRVLNIIRLIRGRNVNT
jgi:glycosyltransferase involved in cell wall biosynthesis